VRRQILWDWNGTLLDDTEAALKAFNIQLRKRGLAPIDLGFYRANFGFPVKPFYARCGVDLAQEDWDAIAREYHAAYAALPKRLNGEAIAALETAKKAGVGQSIVSALRQDLLEAATAEFGVAPYMDFICGTDNLDGSSKITRARQLLTRLGAVEAVVIGDSLHDKEVADALGIRCVLCAQGSHAAERLRGVAPTGETLMEAVRLALDSNTW